jgi:predicted Fe-Mo cluster-binding NifX family protein
MIIAIPIFGNRISPRLDCAKKILLIHIEKTDRKVISCEEIDFQAGIAGKNIEFYLSNEIAVVICGGVSVETQDLFTKHKIKVVSWVTGEADKALDLFLEGNLVSGAMLCPGMRVKRWRFCSKGRVGDPRKLKK